jgi:hypothetical protein
VKKVKVVLGDYDLSIINTGLDKIIAVSRLATSVPFPWSAFARSELLIA